LKKSLTVAVALIAAIVTAIGLGWRYRRVVVDRLPSAVGGLAGRLDRFDAATVEAGIADRLQNFFEDIERVGTSPGRLAAAVGLSLSGWLFQAAALTVAFAAVGHEVAPVVPLFAVPLAYVAGATPPPAGSAESRRRSWRCSSRRPVFRHRRSPLPCSCVPRRRLLDADGDRRRVGVGARRPDGPVAATDRNSATFIWGAATSDVIHG